MQIICKLFHVNNRVNVRYIYTSNHGRKSTGDRGYSSLNLEWRTLVQIILPGYSQSRLHLQRPPSLQAEIFDKGTDKGYSSEYTNTRGFK